MRKQVVAAAPRSPLRVSEVSVGWWAEVRFWGAFLSLDGDLELKSQGLTIHHPSTLEVAPVPRTPRNPSTAEHSKVEQVSALGVASQKEKEEWYTRPGVQMSRWLKFLSPVPAGTRSLGL